MTLRGYLPQLDGIRAVAIGAVVAYHLGYLSGGWLGVDVFFVLSGYLITSILLEKSDHLSNLRGFWGRRARRLLPAVLALLLCLSVYAWLGGPGLVPAQLRPPALATLFYTANWQQVVAGHDYFAQYTAQSPLAHTWSLAIEEQYYLIWPLLLGIILLPERSLETRFRRRFLIFCTVTLAGASAVWMGFAAHIFGINRAYLGTDTRAWELLLGGALAMAWPAGTPTSARSAVWPWVAALGAVVLAAGMWTAGGPPEWIWNGGLVAIALGAGLLIIGSIRAPNTFPSNLLALRPMRWLGVISYSLYLWHWPTIVLINPDTSGLSGSSLLVTRLAAMTAASVVSYYAIERPLRRLDWSDLGRRLHLPATSFASVGIAVAAVAILAGTVGPPKAGSSVVPVATPLAPKPQPIATPVDLRPATPANPYRVWIMGDSIMYDGSLGVTAALQSTGEVSVVTDSAFPGWGLTRDAAWPTEARAMIEQYHPEIVIGTWSWDSSAALDTPQSYLQRLHDALAFLLAPDTGVKLVVLLQLPQTGPGPASADPAGRAAAWANVSQGQRAWDMAAQKATSAFPSHALYLTTDQLFAPGGRYFAWFRTSTGTWLRGRKVDNAHLCPYGAALWGALVTADLTPPLHLPAMKAGWELGAWTRDHRYNNPLGACPDDQPPSGYTGTPVPQTQTPRHGPLPTSPKHLTVFELEPFGSTSGAHDMWKLSI